MKKMAFNFKIFLIVLLPLFGLSYFAFYTIENNISDEKRLSKDTKNIKNVKLINEVIANIQNERGISIAYLTSVNLEDKKKASIDIEKQYLLTDKAIIKFVHDVSINKISTNNDFFKSLTSSELTDFRSKVIRKKVKTNDVLVFFGEISSAGLLLNLFQSNNFMDSQKNLNVMISLVEAKEDLGVLRGRILEILKDTAALQEKIIAVDQQYKFYKGHIKLFHGLASDELIDKFNLYYGSNNSQKTFGVINELVLSKKLTNISREEFWEYSTATLENFQLLINISNDDLEEVVLNNIKNTKLLLTRNIAILIFLVLSTLLFLFVTIRSMKRNLNQMNLAAEKLSVGDYDVNLPLNSNDELGRLALAINLISEKSKQIVSETQRIEKGDVLTPIQLRSDKDVLSISLEKIRYNFLDIDKDASEREWKDKGVIVLAEKMRGESNINYLADNIIALLVTHLKGQIGNLYVKQKEKLVLAGTYASDKKYVAQEINIGEGLVGQVAKTQQLLLCSNIPTNYFNINSSLGQLAPINIIIVPLIFNGKLEGVFEIGSLNVITPLHQEFLEGVAESIGIGLNTTVGREELEKIQLEFSQQIGALNISAIVSEADADGNITFVNDMFCQISGYSREELLGKNHRILKSGNQPDGLFVGMWKSISMGNIWKGEIVNKKKGGGFYWVDTTIMPFKNAEGKIYKYVGIRFDITKQKEQQNLLINQKEELNAQREELQETNSELEAQSQKLQASEEELKVQQEELMQANQELEEKSQLLEEKNQAVNEKNEELETASNELQKKAGELALSSKYKSEFLANMSHELRTPLNSILLLSRLLSDNGDQNLNAEQIEFASVINNSGNSLLELINEILDLSKIESGKMEIDIEPVQLKNIFKSINDLFNPLAKEKGLSYSSSKLDEVSDLMLTDKIRVEQVLKNFLSNSFKFTEKGSVELIVRKPNKEETLKMGIKPDNFVAFEVKDSGIGIQPDKLSLVFEAFQQADGSTRRKYGGTGLGLSISREIARMLGGDVLLKSEFGKGSSFTLIIPQNNKATVSDSVSNEVIEIKKNIISHEPEIKVEIHVPDSNVMSFTPDEIADDRFKIEANDKTILIVEDDTSFAQALVKYVHERGYKVVVAVSGADAVPFALKYKPIGILLDIQLPVKSGWTIMKELKENVLTKHIPIHIMSSLEIKSKDAISVGAIDFMNKSLAQKNIGVVFDRIEAVMGKATKTILLVDENETHTTAISAYISSASKKCIVASTAKKAYELLNTQSVDCVILDMGLPNIDGYEVLETIKKDPKFEKLPVIIYTGNSLSLLEEKKLKQYAGAIIIKTVDSFKRLSSEISLFLHLVEENKKEKVLKKPYIKDKVLGGKHILVVDDDARNIFTLTKLLESQKIKVSTANDGKEALAIMNSDITIDLVLMDMMMPNMDGYEATTEIRNNHRNAKIPVIAVTAKAMLGDREKCISAGANDYVTKPVDGDQLLSLLRVWLYK